MEIKIDLEPFRKGLKDVRLRVMDAAEAALYAEALDIRTDSMKRTPVDYGRLRASTYATLPQDDGSGVTIEIGVGTKYAIFVHERMELKHRVGEAKFLENSLTAAQAGYTERLAERLWKYAERGYKLGGARAPQSAAEGLLQADEISARRENRARDKGRQRRGRK